MREESASSTQTAEIQDRDEPDVEEEEEEEEEPEIDAVSLRTNFNPLANFTPSTPVDKKGKAKIKVEVPDNLTRYR